MCQGDSITIRDPVTGLDQCQDCRKCPAGEGLSVNCGDVISSKTPLVCRRCVLGETYSSAYEAGACKDCENCGEYRETIKACTLTSKAVCGKKCKLGAYEESMLGMCKPCSPCCNDGEDIVVPDCQVPGVPTNMQCSFLKSEKCGKVTTEASVSTPASTLQTTRHSTVPFFPNGTEASIPIHLESADKQLVDPTNGPTNGPSPNLAVIGATIAGGVLFLILVLIVLLAIRYFRAKPKQVCKDDDDVEMQQVQANDDANDSDESETDEPNPGDALLGNTEVALGVEETLDSPLPTGTQDTEPPGPHSSTDFKTVQEPSPKLSCGNHTYIKVKKTTVKETKVCITCPPSTGCRCQL